MARPRPIVSVVMTTLNSRRFIRESLESILAQTLQDWELVVVDGGSTDDTLDIVRSYKDRRIRVFVSDGLRRAAQLNVAIRHCRAEYIAIQDSDDIAMPTRLEREVLFLRGHPRTSLMGSWAISMTEGGADKTVSKFPTESRMISKVLMTQADVCFGTSMWLKSLAVETPFDETLRKAIDYAWYLKVGMRAVMANVPEVLERIRMAPLSLSRTRDESNNLTLVRLAESFVSESVKNRSQSDAGLLWRRLGFMHYYYGSPATARRTFFRAVRAGEFDLVVLRYLLPLVILPPRVVTLLRKSILLHRVADVFRTFLRRNVVA